MKKLFTLLLLTLAAFTFKSKAQTNTTCNAGFTFAISGLSVNFTAAITTVSTTNHQYWQFGDGTASSDISPVHVYASGGTYTVKHIFYKSENRALICIDSVEKRVELNTTTISCNLHAKFSFERDPSQPNNIKFTNLSTPANDIHFTKWTFGDGSYSYDFNATHVFASSGTYNVCLLILTSTNTANTCQRDTCISLQVQVTPPSLCNIEPKFTWKADTINNNKIYFTNASTPTTAAVKVLWSFGDGASSTSFNPDHIYSHAGVYNVCLRIYASSICTREICKTIEIKEPEINCLDISKFTFTRSTVNCLEFKFIPAVQNPNWKYVWSFGDATGSNAITPSHVYQRSGNYTVYLTVYRSSTCTSTSYKVAETGTCFSCNNIWVKYEISHETSAPNKIYFHALSNYPIQSETWTITRLSISSSPAPVILTQNNPVYTFNEPGEYLVCLKAVTYGGCVKEYCEVIHISSPNTACTLASYPNPASNQVSFSVQLTQPEMIHVYICNSLNILVKQKDQQGSTGNNVVTTNIEGLVPGLYNIKVIYGNRICYSRFQKI